MLPGIGVMMVTTALSSTGSDYYLPLITLDCILHTITQLLHYYTGNTDSIFSLGFIYFILYFPQSVLTEVIRDLTHSKHTQFYK